MTLTGEMGLETKGMTLQGIKRMKKERERVPIQEGGGEREHQSIRRFPGFTRSSFWWELYKNESVLKIKIHLN
jgi:hypothetical protein